MKKQLLQSFAAVTLLTATMFACEDHVIPIPEPTEFGVTELTSGLITPLGMEYDDRGNLWVSEIGTGKNDGAVVMISPNGTKTTFASGFTSKAGPEGGPEGISHLMFHDKKLYILHGIDGKLFIADISGFKAGDAQKPISSLIMHDYRTQLLDLGLPVGAPNTNLYDLTVGPDGNIYMVDAGANAVLKRDNATGAVSLFAELPSVGAGSDAVPTGIVFDGSRFLISTLSGFPFAAGNAKIFSVDMSGNVNIYKDGFQTLSHIELTANKKPLVLKLANFALPGGFAPFTGAVQNEDGVVLADSLMMPTDLKRVGDRTYLVSSMPLGKVYKLTY